MLAANPETPPPDEQRPFYKRWPFWTAVGAVIVAGVVIGVVASSGRRLASPEHHLRVDDLLTPT